MLHTIHRDDTATRPDTTPGATRAFLLLRTVFTLAPIVFGLDKFIGLLTDWEGYLAPWINDLVPGSAHDAMLMVGVVEIVAGLAVAVRPRFGGLLVAAWLAGIIVDLVSTGEYYDIALRDAGLLVAAVSLSLLAPRNGTAVRARTRGDRAASGTER
jgi:hypothetical protein